MSVNIIMEADQMRFVNIGPLRLSLLLSFCIGLCGCPKTPVAQTDAEMTSLNGVVVIEGSQTLLTSDIISSTDRRKLLDLPITIKNTSNAVRIVHLTGLGCSCYAMTFNNQPIEKGTALTIEPGGQKVLKFDAIVAETQSSKDYSAEFEFDTDKGTQSFRATCTVHIYSDVSVSPNVITAEADFATGGVKEQKLTITRVLRASERTQATEAPVLDNLPESVDVSNIEEFGEVETLSDDFIRVTWMANLKVTVPEEADPDVPPAAYFVKFPRSNPDQPLEKTSTQGQLIIRSRSPIAFPKTIHFGKFSLGHSRNRRFLITSPEEVQFQLTLVGDLHETIKLDIKEDLATRHWIEVKIEPKATGEFEQTLTFQTGLKEMPTINVQLKAMVE